MPEWLSVYGCVNINHRLWLNIYSTVHSPARDSAPLFLRTCARPRMCVLQNGGQGNGHVLNRTQQKREHHFARRPVRASIIPRALASPVIVRGGATVTFITVLRCIIHRAIKKESRQSHNRITGFTSSSLGSSLGADRTGSRGGEPLARGAWTKSHNDPPLSAPFLSFALRNRSSISTILDA